MNDSHPDFQETEERPLFELGVEGEDRPLFELGAQAEELPNEIELVNPIHENVSNVPMVQVPGLMLAGRGRRFAAKMIDLTICSVVFYAASIGLIAKLPEGPQWGPAIAVGLFGFVGVWFTWFNYNTFLRANTWGKWLMGSRVVDDKGDALNLGKAFGRSWSESLTVLILGLGYLTALFDGQRRTLHDHLSGTRVVRR